MPSSARRSARIGGEGSEGRWTVEMLLIYSLEREDILPVNDFGVRDGYRRLKNLEQALKKLQSEISEKESTIKKQSRELEKKESETGKQK